MRCRLPFRGFVIIILYEVTQRHHLEKKLQNRCEVT